jgi:hypothetical protein
MRCGGKPPRLTKGNVAKEAAGVRTYFEGDGRKGHGFRRGPALTTSIPAPWSFSRTGPAAK